MNLLLDKYHTHEFTKKIFLHNCLPIQWSLNGNLTHIGSQEMK